MATWQGETHPLRERVNGAWESAKLSPPPIPTPRFRGTTGIANLFGLVHTKTQRHEGTAAFQDSVTDLAGQPEPT